MQHEFTDPVADCQEVQVGGILFGTNTRMLGGTRFSLSDKELSSEPEVSSLCDAIHLSLRMLNTLT